MREANFTVTSMHGDMPQKEREAIMKEFRAGETLASLPLSLLTSLPLSVCRCRWYGDAGQVVGRITVWL